MRTGNIPSNEQRSLLLFVFHLTYKECRPHGSQPEKREKNPAHHCLCYCAVFRAAEHRQHLHLLQGGVFAFVPVFDGALYRVILNVPMKFIEEKFFRLGGQA